MSRILNKKELKELKRLKIVSRAESGTYYYFRRSDCITPSMIGKVITEEFREHWTILPWMIKKNWKETGIFEENK